MDVVTIPVWEIAVLCSKGISRQMYRRKVSKYVKV
jgi:hypothetical protein